MEIEIDIDIDGDERLSRGGAGGDCSSRRFTGATTLKSAAPRCVLEVSRKHRSVYCQPV